MTTLHSIEYSKWLSQLKAMFPVAHEFDLAGAIYSFEAAFEDDLTPEQAYEDFDKWARCDDDAF